MPPPADELIPRLFLGPALRTQSDRRLVRLVREGYETAFEEIVRRYSAPLRRYAAAIVGSHADDVTQDSFAKALQALRREQEAEIELRPWLYRIVRNTALNDLRDRPRQAEELAAAIAGGHSAAEEAEQREELTELMARLQALPEPQRAAIVMRELEGLGHEEIAAALGITGGAARQAIHRARTTLRNAAGALIPLPLLRLLIDHGAEAGVAIGAGGVAAAAGATAGGAGGGTALKAGLATALIAGSVGTGVALEKDRQRVETSGPPTATAAESPGAGASAGGESDDEPVSSSSGSGGGGDDDGGRSGSDDDRERRDDRGSDREDGRHDDDDSDDDREERERDDDADDRSGRSGSSGSGGSDSGRSGSNSGPGSGTVAPTVEVDDDDDSSGSGYSNSGSGSSSSGSGSSGSDDEEELDEELELEIDDNSSGPGSGDDD
jgi:RNA polymerase sigma factor (sigma-70 family)